MLLKNINEISIDRAINEFSSGRSIVIKTKKENWIFFPLEYVDKKLLKEISNKSLSKVFIYITKNKFYSLFRKSLKNKKVVAIPIMQKEIGKLKSVNSKELSFLTKKTIKTNSLTKCPQFINDIINLAKNAKINPSLIGCKINSKMINHSTMIFDYNKLKNQENLIAHSTKFLTQSRIPLAKDHKAKIMVYKSFIGGLEHVVIKIGSPKIKNPVNVRIQSACFTGEVFHSMKCDCYEQLHHSINYISKNKGGFIIHLEQEGRGIGLVNKIKAYKLQDQGMNTYNADFSMGFLEEERDFTIAAIILKDLGIKKVNLITNNHQKIKILKNNKIIINKQIPTYPIINKFNFDYLSSKVNKSKYKILVK